MFTFRSQGCGFKSQPGQTKDLKLVLIASLLSTWKPGIGVALTPLRVAANEKESLTLTLTPRRWSA